MSATDRICNGVATVLGAGYCPVAPGTAGTLAGLLLFLLIRPLGPGAVLASAAGLYFLGVWASGRVERALGERDPSRIVIDESAGFFVTMLWLPPEGASIGLPSLLLAAFLLNRVLDIVKPFPASTAQRLPGGWGVMTDDLVSSLYANLLIRLGLWLKGGWI